MAYDPTQPRRQGRFAEKTNADADESVRLDASPADLDASLAAHIETKISGLRDSVAKVIDAAADFETAYPGWKVRSVGINDFGESGATFENEAEEIWFRIEYDSDTLRCYEEDLPDELDFGDSRVDVGRSEEASRMLSAAWLADRDYGDLALSFLNERFQG